MVKWLDINIIQGPSSDRCIKGRLQLRIVKKLHSGNPVKPTEHAHRLLKETNVNIKCLGMYLDGLVHTFNTLCYNNITVSVSICRDIIAIIPTLSSSIFWFHVACSDDIVRKDYRRMLLRPQWGAIWFAHVSNDKNKWIRWVEIKANMLREQVVKENFCELVRQPFHWTSLTVWFFILSVLETNEKFWNMCS